MKKQILTTFLLFSVFFCAKGQLDFKEINRPNPDRSVLTIKDSEKSCLAAAISPNGKYVVSAATAIKVWDSQTGELLKTLSGHTMSITNLTFSSDGKYLASSSNDNTVKLWEIPSGNCIRTFTGHSWLVYGVAFMAKDAGLISVGTTLENTAEVKVWDIGGSLRMDLKGHTNEATSVACSPLGDICATGSADSTFRVWNLSTGQEIKKVKSRKGMITAVTFSPDGKYLMVASKDNVVRRWNTKTWVNNYTYQIPTPVSMVKISPDGTYIAIICQDFSIRIWNFKTGEYISSLVGHKAKMKAIDFSADSKTLIGAAENGEIKLWTTNKFLEQ